MATSDQAVITKIQNGAEVIARNRTGVNMYLIDTVSWSGNFVILPDTIGNVGVARFRTIIGDQGSIAAVKYTVNASTIDKAAIVLAWDAPSIFDPSTSPNKILGIYGPRRLIDDLTWDQVKTRLNNAGSSFEIKDGIVMTGNITNNPTTNVADIVANFLPRQS